MAKRCLDCPTMPPWSHWGAPCRRRATPGAPSSLWCCEHPEWRWHFIVLMIACLKHTDVQFCTKKNQKNFLNIDLRQDRVSQVLLMFMMCIAYDTAQVFPFCLPPWFVFVRCFSMFWFFFCMLLLDGVFACVLFLCSVGGGGFLNLIYTLLKCQVKKSRTFFIIM